MADRLSACGAVLFAHDFSSSRFGVAKPDPAIFDHALPYFAEFDRSRIAYIGDSVTMDIAASSAAGLHPMLLDPYDDHVGADFERISSVAELLTMTSDGTGRP